MLETIILLSFCLLGGLGSLAVVVWLAVTGSLLTMDGLAFALISLTLGGFLMFNVAWAVRSGELKALLGHGSKTGAVEKSGGKPDDAAQR
jgi:hypothetical protein